MVYYITGANTPERPYHTAIIRVRVVVKREFNKINEKTNDLASDEGKTITFRLVRRLYMKKQNSTGSNCMKWIIRWRRIGEGAL